MITPYLSWSLPDSLITSGPTYAQEINNVFLLLDSALGQLFTPANLNINSDLSFNANDATNVRSVRLTNTGSVNGAADVGCIYNNGGNLYFNNAAGAAVQITAGGTVNVGNGNISGLVGTSASLTFDPVANAFTFLANSGTQAGIVAASGAFATIYASASITTPSFIGTSANITNLTGTNCVFTKATAATLSGTNAWFNNANALTLTASQALMTNLTASNALFTALNAPTATHTTATITNGTVTTLTSSNALITTLIALTSTLTTSTLTNANATTLTASNSSLTTFTASNALVNTSLNCASALTASNATIAGLITTNAAFKLTPGNTSTSATMLTMSGDVNAQGGFRQQLPPAQLYSSATAGASTYNMAMQLVDQNSNSNVVKNWTWVAPTQGSVVGIQAYLLATNGTSTCTFTCNGASLVVGSGQSGPFATTFTKDAFTFAAGAALTLTVTTTATFTPQMIAFITVEC